MHFPAWLGTWFFDELTYEERAVDGKWSKPGHGANEAFDLLVYADALAILQGYEKIKWPDAPDWARRETWVENAIPETPDEPPPISAPVRRTTKRKKTASEQLNPWATSGGWI